MFNNSSNFQNSSNINFGQVLNRIKSLSDKDLEAFVEQARKLGISEENISQGMIAINSMRDRK